MALGVVVMVLAGFLLINYFRTINRAETVGQTSSASTENTEGDLTPTPQITAENGQVLEPKAGNEYVVQAGDSLWKISQRTYGTGYSWTQVYEANKEAIGDNPSQLTAGMRINLPESQPLEHTVAAGDNLWNLASTYCGSGTGWQTIAESNDLENPRLIEPGQVLRISCR